MSLKITLTEDDIVRQELELESSDSPEIDGFHKLNRIETEEIFRKKHQTLFDLLTKREREIIKLISEGLNNAQIADQLFISRYTVEQHRKNINRKLDVHSLPQLFKYALAFDLL